MDSITNISSKSRQGFYYITEDGEKVNVSLSFLPTQESWFVDVSTDTFSVNGIRVCTSWNILDKFHNILNFGIRIDTEDGFDPWRVTDFEYGYAVFSFLTKDELVETTEQLNGEAQ